MQQPNLPNLLPTNGVPLPPANPRRFHAILDFLNPNFAQRTRQVPPPYIAAEHAYKIEGFPTFWDYRTPADLYALGNLAVVSNGSARLGNGVLVFEPAGAEYRTPPPAILPPPTLPRTDALRLAGPLSRQASGDGERERTGESPPRTIASVTHELPARPPTPFPSVLPPPPIPPTISSLRRSVTPPEVTTQDLSKSSSANCLF